MKWFSFGVASMLTVALLGGGVGCSKGGKLTVKAPDTTVEQGKSAAIEITITREKYDDPVKLKFTGLPDGVTVEEKDPTVAKKENSVKLNLKAASDAKPVDDHKVTVTATGGDLKAEGTFKVTVKKGSSAAVETKSVTVKADDASVEQGKTAKVKVTITREKFDDDVKLKFSGLPEGVTAEDTTIAKGDKSADVTLKAAADAKVMDDHKVTVTASSGMTITNEATFKVSVKKKGA